MEKPNPTYYAIIPANIRYDNSLTPNAKLLYAEITALTNLNGKCSASTNYFANLYEVSRISIQKWLKQLEVKGYINRDVIYKKGSREIETRYITIINYPSKQILTTPSKHKLTENTTTKVDNNTISKTKVLDEDVKSFWNTLAKENDLPTIQAITPSRKKHILSRIKEVDSFEEFKKLLDFHIKNSAFLKGENNRNWKVDFDWVLNPSNFIKIIEGKYQSKNTSTNLNDEIDHELLARLQGDK